MGEIYIDVSQYGWFPSRLPSEEEQDDDEAADENGQ